MVFLDSTVVNVALPRLAQELSSALFGTLEAQSYVYNGYLLSLSALLILGGALTDQLGRRRMFAWGTAAFGATSLLCGIAPTMELLIVFRVLQGAAGAILVPGSLALITTGFEGELQARAFGVWAGATTATTILGPLVGGVLVDVASWRWAFLVNVPLAAVGVWVTLRWVEPSVARIRAERFDWLGSVIVLVALGGLTLGAIRGQQQQWQEPGAIVAVAVGAITLGALPFHLRRARNPLVPPELFRSRNFTVTNISTLLIYGGLYVVLLFVSIHVQGALGYSATAAGLVTVPGMALLAIFSPYFGSLADRYGPRRFMAIGPAVSAVGLLLLALVPADTDPWRLVPGTPSTWLPPADFVVHFLPGMLLLGAGLTMLVAPLTTALMRSVPSVHSGVASAVNNAISRVGPQLAGALVFVAITASFYTSLAERAPGLDVDDPETRNIIAPLNAPTEDVSPEVTEAARRASADAFALAMVLSAGMLLSGAVVNWFGIEDRSGVRSATGRTSVPG